MEEVNTALQEYIAELVRKSRIAQETFERDFTTQRRVDEVTRAFAKALADDAERLAKKAMEETGMGNVNDKIMKLTMSCLSAWNVVKGQNSVEWVDSPDEPGIGWYPKPLGVLGCIMPSTNPIATIIGNGVHAIKSRNSVIIAPHPSSAKVSDDAINILRAAVAAQGAPADLIQGIDAEHAGIEATNILIRMCDANIATGGKGMVQSVYSCGKPAFGVGQGNCQDIVDEDWKDEDYPMLVQMEIFGRSWDNGVPCVGDQTSHIPASKEDLYVNTMKASGAYVMNKEETDSLRTLLFPDGGTRINRSIVGKLPHEIGEMLNIHIPETAKIILVHNQAWGEQDVLCREILCPVHRYTTYTKFEDAVERAIANLKTEGAGHSSAIWTHNEEHITYVAKRIPVGRFHVNQPTMGMNNTITGSATIGCGSWGGNSISEFLVYSHLLNKTKVTRSLPNVREATPADWDDFEPYNRLAD